MHPFINKLIYLYPHNVILSLGAQLFMIQTGNVKSIAGILLQNSKFNYTHFSGHILGQSPLSNLALCTVDLDLLDLALWYTC